MVRIHIACIAGFLALCEGRGGQGNVVHGGTHALSMDATAEETQEEILLDSVVEGRMHIRAGQVNLTSAQCPTKARFAPDVRIASNPDCVTG